MINIDEKNIDERRRDCHIKKYEQKLNENDQYVTQSRENESHFHYLCSQYSK